MTTAFDPIDLAGRRLANRIAMSPMTRNRAPGGRPTAAAAVYYSQRASAGLIVTEGTQPVPAGQGYPDTPGLHAPEQVAAWREVTAAVHAGGGVIFAQLMHAGRIGHPSLLPPGLHPVGPSAVAAAGTIFTPSGLHDLVAPLELSEQGIDETVAGFARAAANAMSAGFDGVEIHAGNGYLLHQFLSTNANRRNDRWGGGVAGRTRLTVSVAEATAAVVGAGRVGLRISPGNPYNDIVEDGHRETYRALVGEIGRLGLAYLHVAEGPDAELTPALRRQFGGPLVLNPFTPGRPTGPQELRLVDEGRADVVAFGALFLANPDLPARLAAGGPYNVPERATYYGGGERGYTDYPTMAGPATGEA